MLLTGKGWSCSKCCSSATPTILYTTSGSSTPTLHEKFDSWRTVEFCLQPVARKPHTRALETLSSFRGTIVFQDPKEVAAFGKLNRIVSIFFWLTSWQGRLECVSAEADDAVYYALDLVPYNVTGR